jgi:hypothetical protein
MPPKHRQLHAPCPKASGNAYQYLVDPPHDGKHLSFDGGDEQTDGYDSNTVVNANLRDSGLPASTPSQDIVLQWISQNILHLKTQMQAHVTRTESALAIASEENAHLHSKMDSLLQHTTATEPPPLHFQQQLKILRICRRNSNQKPRITLARLFQARIPIFR